MPGTLTAQFPSDEPERTPALANDFEAASFTDTQAEQDEARISQLEEQRATPQVQGTAYTIGGADEQATHETVIDDRELEIRELQARVDRQRDRSQGRGL